jgi:electron transfer flavoprotein alpha subunit
MKAANTCVAVNRDARAPILSVADHGIVDNILRTIPALTERVVELTG